MSVKTTISFTTRHSISECDECRQGAFAITENLIDEAEWKSTAQVYAHGEPVHGTITGTFQAVSA